MMIAYKKPNFWLYIKKKKQSHKLSNFLDLSGNQTSEAYSKPGSE